MWPRWVEESYFNPSWLPLSLSPPLPLPPSVRYDAYMTAAAFAGLTYCLQARDGEDKGQREVGGRSSREGGRPPCESRLKTTWWWWWCQDHSLEALAGYAYRLNLMRSDMKYLALSGPAPSPDRSHVFILSHMNPEVTAATIIDLFESVGMSRPRMTWIDRSMVRVEVAGCYLDLPSKLEASGWQGKCTPFDEADLKEESQPKKTVKRKLETNAIRVEAVKGNRCVVM